MDQLGQGGRVRQLCPAIGHVTSRLMRSDGRWPIRGADQDRLSCAAPPRRDTRCEVSSATPEGTGGEPATTRRRSCTTASPPRLGIVPLSHRASVIQHPSFREDLENLLVLTVTHLVAPVSDHRLVFRYIQPVRRLVWRCTSEPERDKSVFGVASMSRLSGFRGNETGHARANVQSPHLRLL